MKLVNVTVLLICTLHLGCHPKNLVITKGYYTVTYFWADNETLSEGMGILQGFVRDAGTGEFIGGYVILNDNPQDTYKTNERGFFKIILQEGSYKLSARGLGLPLDTKLIRVKRQKIVEVVIYLGHKTMVEPRSVHDKR